MLNKTISLIKFYGLNSIVIIYRFMLLKLLANVLKLDRYKIKVYNFELLVPLQQGGLTTVLTVFQGRELDHKFMLENVLKTDDIILDLGSNIGYYVALENAILSGNAHFYCIEPDERNLKYLKQNLVLHGISDRAEVTLGAISDYNGSISFNFNTLTNLNSVEFEHSHNEMTADVPCYDIVDYLKFRKPVDVIRMDIEGHELVVLAKLAEGIANQIVSAPRVIIFETHFYPDKNEAVRVLTSLLSCGYTFKYLSSDDEHKGASSSFKLKGLNPIEIIPEWSVARGIYSEVDANVAVKIVSDWEGSRTVCLELGE